MGLSASQARFLQLTARRGDIEYEAQQINFQRLQLSQKLASASSEYQDRTTNRKLMFAFNTGANVQKVELSYTNYKNYMNQQLEGLSTTQDKYYLVSSSGKKLVVSSEEEKQDLMAEYTKYTPLSEIESAKAQYAQAEIEGTTANLSPNVVRLSKIDLTKIDFVSKDDGEGNMVDYYVERQFEDTDFLIAEDLTDVSKFQRAIQNGTYYFAQFKENMETHEPELKTVGWDVLGAGAITEDLDKSDDAEAEAKYKNLQDKVQAQDKKLELRLDKIETERNAIQTEMDSVKKVIEDNIEKTYNIFG